MTYTPLTYVQDIEALLEELGCDRFVAFGTSLGGIVTMLLAGMAPQTIVGALLNDVGPEIEAAGLARIRTYVGKASSWPTWMHAARAVADANGDVYPDYAISDWLAMQKRLYRLTNPGRILPASEHTTARPFRV